MSFPRYPEYKDSGVGWLGEVPTHWQVHRLKNLFEIRKRIVGEEGHQVLSITQRGIRIKDVESNDGQLSMDYSKYQIVQPGDFAMNHMDLLTGFVDISPYAGVTSPDYRVFVVREGTQCDPRYFLSLLQNGFRQKIFYAFGQGASEFGRWRLPTDQFNDFRFPFPPADEQASIATFLDRETVKIDALVAEQEKLIALLQEKRQAVISHAVTKGLNPNVPMKNSGVEWLGEVPGHWEVRALKSIVSTPITDGPHETPQFLDEGIPFVSAEAVAQGFINFDKVRGHISPEDHLRYSQKYLPRRGDVYMVKSGATTGVTALVETDLEFNIWSPLAALRCGEKMLPKFLLHYMRSRHFQEAVTLNWSFGTQQNIGMGVIGDLSAPIPTLSEQAAIATFLDSETAQLDALTAQARSAITLLQERRTALISAAVTGQIDVRGLSGGANAPYFIASSAYSVSA